MAKFVCRLPVFQAPASQLLLKLDRFQTKGRETDVSISFPCFAFSLASPEESIGHKGDAEISIGGEIVIDKKNKVKRQSICANVIVKMDNVSEEHPSIPKNSQHDGGYVARRFHFDYDAKG